MFKGKKKKIFGGLVTSQEQPLTMIGEGISVVGTMRISSGVVRLDGRFEGKILGPGTLVIGEKGSFHGEMEVNTLTLSGKSEGSVMATSNAHIHSTGQLFGKIQTPLLVIEQGAVFDGEGKTVGREGAMPPVGSKPASDL